MKPLARVGRREREVVEHRRANGYAVDELAHFGGRLEPTLRSLLEQLLPGRTPAIDLVAFVDRHAAAPMGRGDRREGAPPTPDLLVRGVTVLADEGFDLLPDAEQRAVIARMRNGEPHGALGELAKEFVDRLLDKALAGYLAHPETWARIGFNGPAYPDGYAWIGTAEVVARHAGKPGWDRL